MVVDALVDSGYFVTVIKPLESKRWKMMSKEKLSMTWEKATVIDDDCF
jgi:hypothetical protein